MNDAETEPILRVGLTGGIACGKSEVSRELRRLGCEVIDADQIARDVVEPECEGWRRIVGAFGQAILRGDRTIDRRALGAKVFADPARREALNQMLHPLILQVEEDRIEGLVKGGFRGIVMVEAALMIEAGSYKKYRYVVVVYCKPPVQLKRLMLRDRLDIGEAERRIGAQMFLEEKKKFATHLIDTSGSLRDTRDQVRTIYYALLDEFLRREAGPAEPLA